NRTGFVWAMFSMLAAAMPAPAQSLSNQSLSGKYFFRHVSLGLDGSGNLTDPRSLLGAISFDGNGNYSCSGQQVSNSTYTMGPDGTGSFSFGAASTAQLLSGSRTIYVSADGNILLGGNTAAGSHDFLFAVKSLSGATNITWNGDYFGAGLRVDPNDPGQPVALGYAAAVSARGLGTLTWTKRFKEVGAGAYDFTGTNSYSLTADGAGTADLSSVA